MGTESRLRQRIRAAIFQEWPDVMVVGQPANGMTGPGRHDLYAVVRGVYVGLEVKTSTGRATQVQLDRLKRTRRAGGWAWLVRSTWGACEAISRACAGPPGKDHMAEEFDIDKLLASFRPDDAPDKEERQDAWPEEQALSGEDPDDLNRPIAGFVPSEEHIAAAAQANGSVGGDGSAVGDIPGWAEVLTEAVNSLTAAVRELRSVAAELRESRTAATDLPAEGSSVMDALLSVPADPSPPQKPPTRRRPAK